MPGKVMVTGIDEVGRGPWAGPLLAVAVTLDMAKNWDGIKDSKQLSDPKRRLWFRRIQQDAAAIGTGWASNVCIDKYGLTQATKIAMRSAWLQLCEQPGQPKGVILIDGNINYLPAKAEARTLIKGDEKEPSIAAASIAAKVLRDSYMRAMDGLCPGYGFGSNVGYGTGSHREALSALGVCRLHRRSFAPVRQVAESTGGI